MERTVLHCDCNNFYASVECLYNPELRDKPLAVAGSTEQRRGIILAKNYIAKSMGIKTGISVSEAKRICRDLVIVPPHYDLYMQKSRQLRGIYERYTDMIESMGADECWLDITGCERYLRKTPYETALEIKESVKIELGITVSIGVSFNKVYAKLGSDMKKPDAITVISRENYRELLRNVPASDMLGVGGATGKKLANIGIRTLGQLADYPADILAYKFGKLGVMLSRFAGGEDKQPVIQKDTVIPIKSVGHCSNALTDIKNNDEVWDFMLCLSLDIGRRLRDNEKYAYGVSVTVRENDLYGHIYQHKFGYPTQSPMTLATEAYRLFKEKHRWTKPLRSVGISAVYLNDEAEPRQLTVFDDGNDINRREKLDEAVYRINSRFGRNTLFPATLLSNTLYPDENDVELIMPSTGFSYST